MSLWTRIFGGKAGSVPPTQPAAIMADWQPQHGEWTTRYSCHCGHIYDGIPFSCTVCPACGCQDSLKVEVGRLEWEEDRSFYRRVPPEVLRLACFIPDVNTRNRHWVPKPEGCQKVDAA